MRRSGFQAEQCKRGSVESLLATDDARPLSNDCGYAVSRDGRVFSKKSGSWRMLALIPHVKTGHLGVTLYIDGQSRRRSVHVLVLEAFFGPCPRGLECRHLDGNPANNTVGNLKWGTRQENVDDMVLHGTTCHGERSTTAVLTEQQAIEVRRRSAAGEGATAIAKSLGISYGTVHSAIHGKSWSHLPGQLPCAAVSGTKGELRPMHKLKERDVPEIRRRYWAGESPSSIARDYGVSPSTITNTAMRRVWKHVA